MLFFALLISFPVCCSKGVRGAFRKHSVWMVVDQPVLQNVNLRLSQVADLEEKLFPVGFWFVCLGSQSCAGGSLLVWVEKA